MSPIFTIFPSHIDPVLPDVVVDVESYKGKLSNHLNGSMKALLKKGLT